MKALFGSIKIQADERGRIRIPSSFREYFGDSDLYCTVINGAKCLTIFGQQTMDNLYAQMGGQTEIGETENYCRMRDFLESIRVINEDKQKRFTLTQDKDDIFFEVEREMVFVGIFNKLELWRKSDYDEYKANRKQVTGGVMTNAEGKALTW
ncbi:MAG: hypothetical protein K2O35_06975 [Clostridia bacterium]|nr:hypothetical protein [Clostridia bacterium]